MYKILINLTYIFIKYKFRIKIYLLFHQALLEITLIMLCKIKKYQNYNNSKDYYILRLQIN